MTLREFALRIIEVMERGGGAFMLVGALAAGAYGIPRSTKDVDFLVLAETDSDLASLIGGLESFIAFDPQVVFDTITWGRRHVGVSKGFPPYKAELFELFDDPFVREEFRRRERVYVPSLERETWLPTAEDVIVQKLRWGRSKDLDDARDILAVQGPESLDMTYVEKWCVAHGTLDRLRDALDGIPPL